MQEIINECGRFYIDTKGILQDFIPADNNLVHDNFNDATFLNFTLRDLIIPEGVKGFKSDSFRHIKVTGKFQLPNSLESIGEDYFNSKYEQSCVFANTILPTVIIPEGVKKLGVFAFGDCHIDELWLPQSIRSQYGRQFKDGYIGKVYIPQELKEHLNKQSQDYGWLFWPSTTVGEYIFI